MDKYVGKKLDGRYEIQDVIGVGGMAVVYKAYDSIDGRVVAVKILKDEFLSNEEFRRRFKNESKAIAVLSHPNIVKVYDVSFSDKLQYIVMEYIDGITLKEYIDQQKVLTWREAVHFTVQILKALEHAHERGIVHRDIKPQNIMLLSDGTIKVMDFGIARFSHSGTSTMTMTDKAIGSVHYISPEQARGDFTDDKSDIYSVGVMLYEMLTGSLPFEADSAVSVAIMQMQAEPKAPREINDSIPEGLEDITLKAMQKEPSQRYQSASEMLADIDKFKQNPSIHFEYKYFIDDNPTKYVDSINQIKGAEEKSEKGRKKKQKKPVIPILAGIAAALLLVALASVVVYLGMNGYLPGVGQSNTQVEVPNLVGQNYNDVVANSKYKNFNIVKSNTTYSDTVPVNAIISQSPNPPMRIKPNGTISVVISKGPQTAQVPDTYGMEAGQAETLLASSGFKTYTVTQVADDNTTKGCVVYTDPARGTAASVSKSITLYVSTGPKEQITTVPDVRGMNVNDAQSKLQAAHLVVNVTRQNSSTAAKDTVISQSITPQQNVPYNQTITIVVSDGPPESSSSQPQGASFTYSSSVPSSRKPYAVNVTVGGGGFLNSNGNLPTVSSGGSFSFTIPAGQYTGVQTVDVYLSGGDKNYPNEKYQEFKVDFGSGKIVGNVSTSPLS